MREPEGWDERYAASGDVWSGAPNPQLVEEVTGLEPGRALEIGCGEGADAIWLATQGWHVTATDFSCVGLGKAAKAAEAAGVSGMIEWRELDARHFTPGPEHWDLVHAHYLHIDIDEVRSLIAGLAQVITPGGTLLVVGHHPADIEAGLRRPNANLLYTAEDLAAALPEGEWDISAESRTRPATGPDGEPATATDAVLVAVKR